MRLRQRLPPPRTLHLAVGDLVLLCAQRPHAVQVGGRQRACWQQERAGGASRQQRHHLGPCVCLPACPVQGFPLGTRVSVQSFITHKKASPLSLDN